jgi:hypothetical protein
MQERLRVHATSLLTGHRTTARHGQARAFVLAATLAALAMVAIAGPLPAAAAAEPTVSKVEPGSGPVAGGTTVTITGTNFTGATAVMFGSRKAKSFKVNSEFVIVAVSPLWGSGNAIAEVTVTTPGGTSHLTIGDSFIYEPTVTRLEPRSGPTTGGTSVTITGSAFEGHFENGAGEMPPFVSAVSFGSESAASFKANSPTSINAVSPPGTGAVDVTVKTLGGLSPISPADRFTFGPPHYYVNGARLKEGAMNMKTFIGWGTLIFKGVKGGIPGNKITCHWAAAGTLLNPAGQSAGEGSTQVFSGYACQQEFVCPSETTSSALVAEKLPWRAELTEEVPGTIRQETESERVSVECFKGETLVTTVPFHQGPSEKGQRPKVVNGTSALHPSALEYDEGAGILELGDEATITGRFEGALKLLGYNAQEMIGAKNP